MEIEIASENICWTRGEINWIMQDLEMSFSCSDLLSLENWIFYSLKFNSIKVFAKGRRCNVWPGHLHNVVSLVKRRRIFQQY